MCGRYNLTVEPETLAELFRLAIVPEYRPRYNIAPTQDALVIRQPRRTGERVSSMFRWGLVPFWAKDPSVGGATTINARVESVADKPTFREPFRQRRCLIPATGFYEWQKPDSPRGVKQPFHIHPPEAGGVWAFAGLWDRWRERPDDPPLTTFTILTTAAVPEIEGIHPRMPLVLPAAVQDAWLDPEQDDPEMLHRLLREAPGPSTAADPVSRFVNAVANDDPRCLDPDDPAAGTLFG